MTARETIENLWDRAVPVGPLLDTVEAEARAAAPAGPAPATGRAAVLREAADLYANLTDQNEAYDLAEDGAIDEESRIRYDTVRDVVAGLRRLAGEAQQDEGCTRCRHPKRDHDGRADHRAKYSPLVAGEPWCHACNAECDYAREARQDPTQDGTAPRPATVAWDFEGEYEAGKWHGIGTTYRNGEYDQALAYLDRRAETDKQHRRIRMVRAATTYTVEAERTPAAVARPGQPDTDPETQS